jgi:hypothetical protein
MKQISREVGEFRNYISREIHKTRNPNEQESGEKQFRAALEELIKRGESSSETNFNFFEEFSTFLLDFNEELYQTFLNLENQFFSSILVLEPEAQAAFFARNGSLVEEFENALKTNFKDLLLDEELKEQLVFLLKEGFIQKYLPSFEEEIRQQEEIRAQRAEKELLEHLSERDRSINEVLQMLYSDELNDSSESETYEREEAVVGMQELEILEDSYSDEINLFGPDINALFQLNDREILERIEELQRIKSSLGKLSLNSQFSAGLLFKLDNEFIAPINKKIEEAIQLLQAIEEARKVETIEISYLGRDYNSNPEGILGLIDAIENIDSEYLFALNLEEMKGFIGQLDSVFEALESLSNFSEINVNWSTCQAYEQSKETLLDSVKTLKASLLGVQYLKEESLPNILEKREGFCDLTEENKENLQLLIRHLSELSDLEIEIIENFTVKAVIDFSKALLFKSDYSIELDKVKHLPFLDLNVEGDIDEQLQALLDQKNRLAELLEGTNDLENVEKVKEEIQDYISNLEQKYLEYCHAVYLSYHDRINQLSDQEEFEAEEAKQIIKNLTDLNKNLRKIFDNVTIFVDEEGHDEPEKITPKQLREKSREERRRLQKELKKEQKKVSVEEQLPDHGLDNIDEIREKPESMIIEVGQQEEDPELVPVESAENLEPNLLNNVLIEYLKQDTQLKPKDGEEAVIFMSIPESVKNHLNRTWEAFTSHYENLLQEKDRQERRGEEVDSRLQNKINAFEEIFNKITNMDVGDQLNEGSEEVYDVDLFEQEVENYLFERFRDAINEVINDSELRGHLFENRSALPFFMPGYKAYCFFRPTCPNLFQSKTEELFYDFYKAFKSFNGVVGKNYSFSEVKEEEQQIDLSS